MDKFDKIIDLVLKMSTQSRSKAILSICFAVIDVSAGFYVLLAVNWHWIFELDLSKIILLALLISLAPLILLIIYFLGGDDTSIDKKVYSVMIADMICWSWTGCIYLLLNVFYRYQLYSVHGNSISERLLTIAGLYFVSFVVLTVMIKVGKNTKSQALSNKTKNTTKTNH